MIDVTVAVSGSVANDYLMTFPGKFRELIVAEQIERLSLSFLVDDLEIRRGGVAANISFGMGQLGLEPVLVAAVGQDFLTEYGPWLTNHGVDISSVRVSDEAHTSLFLCTTDEEQNQIASFYPGAMAEAPEVDLGAIAEQHGGFELVVVCPNEPAAMLRHTEQAREAGWPFAADPSQQLARLEGAEIRELVDGAAYLLSNDYEAALIEQKTGWSDDEVLRRVDVRVTTHGPKGAVIERSGEPAIEVPAVAPAEGLTLEPTGVGDAFRAGFLAARGRGLVLERSAQLGALLATSVLETVGTQEYTVEPKGFLARLAEHYGDDAAADIEPLLRARS